MKRKTLQELTIKNNFMFVAVMSDPENCKESPNLAVNDGIHTIILSNRGENPSEISPKLVKFLEFTKASLEESEIESKDAFIRRLQESIRRIKSDRRMEDRYMVLEMLLKEERKEGREEGRKEGRKEGVLYGKYEDIFSLLEPLGIVSERMKNIISEIDDEKILVQLLRFAAKANSLTEFESKMKEVI